MLFRASEGAAGLELAMAEICTQQATQAIHAGNNILILSDRGVDKERAPIPALLACAGLHHHLIREGTRTRVGLILETGRAARGASLLAADRLRGRARSTPTSRSRPWTT